MVESSASLASTGAMIRRVLMDRGSSLGSNFDERDLVQTVDSQAGPSAQKAKNESDRRRSYWALAEPKQGEGGW